MEINVVIWISKLMILLLAMLIGIYLAKRYIDWEYDRGNWNCRVLLTANAIGGILSFSGLAVVGIENSWILAQYTKIFS